MAGTVFEYPRGWYEFTASKFQLRTVGLTYRPVFRQTQKTSRLIEQFFAADYVQKPSRGPSSWQEKEAWFALLEGDTNYLRISDPLRCVPLYNRIKANRPQPQPFGDGTWFTDGTGWVDGAVPEFATLTAGALRGDEWATIGGLPESITGLLNPGDLFEHRPDGIAGAVSRLYQCVSMGHTNEDGVSAVKIRPRWRENVVPGDQIVFAYPQAVMQLIDSEQAMISRDANYGSFGFSCAEHTG